MYGLRQLEDLMRKPEQFLGLPVLFLHKLPVLVCDGLAFRVRAVLADQYERREEDRLEGDDHRQEAVRVMLHLADDPRPEPEGVDVDEPHRAGKGRDPVGDPVLDALGALARLLDENRVRLERELLQVFRLRAVIRRHGHQTVAASRASASYFPAGPGRPCKVSCVMWSGSTGWSATSPSFGSRPRSTR